MIKIMNKYLSGIVFIFISNCKETKEAELIDCAGIAGGNSIYVMY